MWVKGSSLQFIVNIGSQMNLILVEVIKRLGLLTTTHPQPYVIVWLHQVQDLIVNEHYHFRHNIKTFTYEVLCDVSPPEVCDVLLVQPCLWKRHVVYESRLHIIVINFDNKLYSTP